MWLCRRSEVLGFNFYNVAIVLVRAKPAEDVATDFALFAKVLMLCSMVALE